jgi:hypothetical protein
MEARSNPVDGNAVVCLKQRSAWVSFQPSVCQDIFSQTFIGCLSIVILLFKFALRHDRGFGSFEPPTAWIVRLCQGAAILGTPTDFQLLHWSWKSGGRWSFAHAVVLVILGIVALVPRLVRNGSVGQVGIRNFWLADACVWAHCSLSGTYSVHLSQAAEYPVTG